ncbi:MAG: biotin--[acetyl-CoA-carboxylase] ligase [Brevefilum sp.]
MEDRKKLNRILKGNNLGGWQYHERVGSTNDLALAWAKENAPDWALVLADEQTSGRGRAGRKWVTQPGSALAMSLVLRPSQAEKMHLARFTAFAALGLIRALARFGLRAELKWPNDVLLGGRKVAGVLVEADWQGPRLEALVVGLGVNVLPGSVPNEDRLRYPAISVQEMYEGLMDRLELLDGILQELKTLRKHLLSQEFMAAWNEALAFREEWVWFRSPGGEPHLVRILGVGLEGELLLERADGEEYSTLAGEIVMAYN